MSDASLLTSLTDAVPWWVFCAIFATGAAAYGILLRYIPHDAHPSASGVIFAGIPASIHIALTLTLAAMGEPVPYTIIGISAAVVTGLAFVAMDLALIATFRAGAPVSLAMPIFRIVATFGAVLVGVAFFAESLTLTKVLGAILCALGIFLLSQKTPQKV